ncbi:MAG TPA: hypothetical protein VN329_08995, partial [Roseomonas sp.]|nr:hypothetical protein [Roseomonas sp.]
MPVPAILPAPLFVPEEPPAAAEEDVLVAGTTPLPAEDAPVAVAPVPAEAPPAPAAQVPPPAALEPAPPAARQPAFTLPEEGSFPTRAELDAILAAHAGPPAGPDAAERAAAAAVLGLDPAIAEDPARYDATIAALPEPDADAILAIWIGEAEAGLPPAEAAEPAG